MSSVIARFVQCCRARFSKAWRRFDRDAGDLLAALHVYANVASPAASAACRPQEPAEAEGIRHLNALLNLLCWNLSTGGFVVRFNVLLLIAVLAVLSVPAHAAQSGRYTVVRKQLTIASLPDDDMRPQIVGTVVDVGAGSTTLKGGARVPATGAKLGDLARFVCASIDTGNPPVSTDCQLVSSQAPDKKPRDYNNFWDCPTL